MYKKENINNVRPFFPTSLTQGEVRSVPSVLDNCFLVLATEEATGWDWLQSLI